MRYFFKTQLMAPQSLVPSTYAALRNRVRQVLILGQERIEQEKLRTYWEAGRLIHTYLQGKVLAKRHADYGKRVIQRLSKDLGIGDLVLYRIIRFAQLFPNLSDRTSLRWSHYRALIMIGDEKKRLALAERAARLGWTSPELEGRIRRSARMAEGKEDERPLATKADLARFSPKRGKLHTYRLVHPAPQEATPVKGVEECVKLFPKGDNLEATAVKPWCGVHLKHVGLKGKHPESDSPLAIDLGFSTFIPLPSAQSKRFEEGNIIQAESPSLVPRRLSLVKDAKASDFYTYQASLERVIDGDTLWMHIELGLGIVLRQKLRLRGIDAPELHTKAGQQAKRFVEKMLSRDPQHIIITTTKPDKFDRYLTDVWLGETNLNRLLLERGLARYHSDSSDHNWNELNWGRF